MSNEIFHSSAADPFGLAIDNDIVLRSVSGGRRRDFVELMSAAGIYIPAAAQEIKPVEEFTVEYELYDSTLTLPLGALVNTDMLITAVSANSDSMKRPTVSVTGIRFSATDKVLASLTAGAVLDALTIDIEGGFGVVNKYGATVTRPISSTMSISMQIAERYAEESGDYLANGYVQYGFKRTVGFESYTIVGEAGTITGVDGAKVTSRDKKTSSEGWETYSVNYFEYLGTVAPAP